MCNFNLNHLGDGGGGGGSLKPVQPEQLQGLPPSPARRARLEPGSTGALVRSPPAACARTRCGSRPRGRRSCSRRRERGGRRERCASPSAPPPPPATHHQQSRGGKGGTCVEMLGEREREGLIQGDSRNESLSFALVIIPPWWVRVRVLSGARRACWSRSFLPLPNLPLRRGDVLWAVVKEEAAAAVGHPRRRHGREERLFAVLRGKPARLAVDHPGARAKTLSGIEFLLGAGGDINHRNTHRIAVAVYEAIRARCTRWWLHEVPTCVID